jgi:hypothetical protein
MQRAKQAATHATPTAAALLVAPLVELTRAGDDAKERGRLPRALELYERALALAETTMPESTLLAAIVLKRIVNTRMTLASSAGVAAMSDTARIAAVQAAWRDDGQLLRVAALFRGKGFCSLVRPLACR